MEKATAKVFKSGRSQAVRIPRKFCFDNDEVFVEQRGEDLVLTPKPKSWDQYFAEARYFSEDFPDQIENMIPQERSF